jgi:hypothetical protein
MQSGAIENPMIIVVKTTAGKYVKVYLKQFIENDQPGFLKFDYEFIPLEGTTGISTFPSENVAIYPNPVSDVLNVNLSQKANIAVYNLIGSLVDERNAESGLISIPVSQWAKGTYIVRINSGNDSQTQKVIVK